MGSVNYFKSELRFLHQLHVDYVWEEGPDVDANEGQRRENELAGSLVNRQHDEGDCDVHTLVSAPGRALLVIVLVSFKDRVL